MVIQPLLIKENIMRVLTSIWYWFLRRHWFIKLWIVLIIIGSISSIFDNSVDNDSLSTGDCVVDAGIIPTANMQNSVSAPTSFEVVDCVDPRATAKVMDIKEMYKQDCTDKQWEAYANQHCPEMSTSFTYPKGLISDRFTCWLDEYAYGLRINLVTETIEETS
jgi:hypothetical protein